MRQIKEEKMSKRVKVTGNWFHSQRDHGEWFDLGEKPVFALRLATERIRDQL